MASKAPLQQPGLNDLGWDVPLNSNFQIAADALGAITSLSVTTTNVTLTATQAQTAGIAVGGSLTNNRSLLLPQNCIGFWFIYNSTSNGFALSIYNDNGAGSPAGTGITLPINTVAAPNNSYVIYSDGTNVNYAASNVVQKTGDTMTGTLNLASNGLNVGSGQLLVTGGNVTTSGQFTASNNVTAYSDERLKENIKLIENALTRVNAMRGVTFTTKKDGAPGVGFIAQQIQPLIPEAVYEDYAGYLHVAYGNITALLVNAINELTERVEKLENK